VIVSWYMYELYMCVYTNSTASSVMLQLYYVTMILFYNYIMLQLYYCTIIFSTQCL